ncbi:sensor histidine kinase [Corticibacter populi]|uniref:histidine kinase n=1 Tax=Corticibacter populi TaxID=1550736 RepID=A0A3M6QYA8_9BURK|nr:sensor histidine kinase [Corticibacter populi]RMX08000.1 sensor histidine kinase [Corticibacter populi]
MTGPSLKLRLLAWTVPVLLLGSVAGIWSSWHVLREQAEQAYDRALAGVVRAIDLNISTDSGGLALAQPYQLLEFFRLTASGNVYWRVSTEDGLAEIGHARLPMPQVLPPSEQLHFFYDHYMDGEPVRVAMLVRDMDPPLPHAGTHQRVIVQVAESMEERERYTRSLVLQSIGRDLLLMLLLVLTVVGGVIVAFRPLVRLQGEVARRAGDDLRPIALQGIPAEVVPLVQGINGHMARFAERSRMQRQFLDDASHQLRTPLAMLRTKLEYALREPDPQEMHAALLAMRNGLDRAERVTNQMLSLAKAHDAGVAGSAQQRQRFELGALLEESVRLLLPAARVRKLDYGLELPEQKVHVFGLRLLLQEAILNLLDNAIKYSPVGGTVLASLELSGRQARIVVQDTGPGMSAGDRQQAGVRFRRGAAGRGTSGAGLGLAIVDAIVRAHHGQMRLLPVQPDAALPESEPATENAKSGPAEGPDPGTGLRVELVFSLVGVNTDLDGLSPN